jgi:uncharacterized LabA/DUF88 family protein
MNRRRIAALLLLGKRSDNMPPTQRFMLFIDGENLVITYQKMIKKDEIPLSHVKHRNDVYAWSNIEVPPRSAQGPQILRANYYTSYSGSDPLGEEIEAEIKTLPIVRFPSSAENLYPVLFKKPKGEQAKGVDIQLTLDILSNVYHDNLDIVCLYSGDGDFTPVLEEAIHYGKRVYVAAFANNFSPKLKRVADKTFELDSYFFRPR